MYHLEKIDQNLTRRQKFVIMVLEKEVNITQWK